MKNIPASSKATVKVTQTLSMIKSLSSLHKETHPYCCTEPTVDHILDTLHHLGYHLWQKTLML